MNKINALKVHLLVLLSVIIFSPLKLFSKDNCQEGFNYCLRLDMFSDIKGVNEVISYDNFRSKFNKIAVVPFTDNCEPCELKMNKWMINCSLLGENDNFAVLFVLRGFDLDKIIHKFNHKCKLNKNYFFVDDFRYLYASINKDIPIDILEESVVVDNYSKIIFAGNPFVGNELKKEFYTLISDN